MKVVNSKEEINMYLTKQSIQAMAKPSFKGTGGAFGTDSYSRGTGTQDPSKGSTLGIIIKETSLPDPYIFFIQGTLYERDIEEETF